MGLLIITIGIIEISMNKSLLAVQPGKQREDCVPQIVIGVILTAVTLIEFSLYLWL